MSLRATAIKIGAGFEPLLDAGFCVDLRYDAGAVSFERDGRFESVVDSYVIGGEIPDPGRVSLSVPPSRSSSGDAPLGGPSMNWNAVPLDLS